MDFTRSFRAPLPLTLEGNISSEWTKFKKQFDIFFIAITKGEEMSEEVKIAMLLNLMGEKAMEVFETLNLTAENRKKYGKVIEALDSYCQPKNFIIYERFKFHTRKQQAGETFDNFLTEITNQAKKCDFTNTQEPITDQMIRDRIVLGISNADVQERLLRTPDLSLSKAIEQCRIAEATHQQAKEVQQSQQVLAVQKSGPSRQQQRNRGLVNKVSQGQRMINDCRNCSRSHKINSCPAYGKKCNKCGKNNHFSSVCLSQNSNKQKSKRNINEVGLNDSEDLDSLVIDTIAVKSVNSVKGSWYKKLNIEGHEINFKIDTGAEVNILPNYIFRKIFTGKQNLKPTHINLVSYGGHKLKVLGVINLEVSNELTKIREKFIVADVRSAPIIGLGLSVKLKLIKRIDELGFNSLPNTKKQFLELYKPVFQGLGCFPDLCKIFLRRDAIPSVKSPRRIPLALKSKVHAKLQDMEKVGIITKVKRPTTWVHNLVIIEKPDKTVRLCLDPRELNKNALKDPFEIPQLEDLSSKLKDMEYYTVLDLKDGFWQIKLDPQSSDLCAFSTPFGTYKFLRMPFGLKFAPEFFQK